MNNQSRSIGDGAPSLAGGLVLGGLRRSTRFVAQHGLAGAFLICARHLKSRLLGRGVLTGARPAEMEFDLKYGVETASDEGDILNLATVSSPNWMHGVKYEGAREEFLDILDSLPLAHEDFTFIDLGSGKGKALFHAASHPFRRIVGVEYSRRLHETALMNIGKYSNPARQCDRIESVCLDAAAYEFPREASLVCLFNPFDRSVTETVVANLVASIRRHPRKMLILYFHAVHADVFLKAGFREKRRWSKAFTSVLLEPA